MITFRPHQIKAVDAVEAAFRAGINRPLIDSCVGSGKSFMYAELARREIDRGGRVIIGAHTEELVQQNAEACRKIGLPVGINSAGLGERVWRAPVISASIQSVFRHAQSFGPITLLVIDECHRIPHAESGMYRELHRNLSNPRLVGGSGTVYRMQGGSLVEGEDAPFDQVVFRYSIVDGINDGYLVPAFSLGATDKVDPTKLRIRNGEYTGESSDAQMIAACDNHIAQMVAHGWEDRKAWLVFEASTKSAIAMTGRMRQWGIPTGIVLGKTPPGEAAREDQIKAFKAGRLRAMVNVGTLTTGFDDERIDLLVMRRRTQSRGLYEQMAGRGLRCIGGNIDASIVAGKPECSVLDFADNIGLHGPLDFIRIKETKQTLTACEECGKRNRSGAMTCWSCGAKMSKNCPMCLEAIPRAVLDCPHCAFDMRKGPTLESSQGQKLSDTPSGAALISSLKGALKARAGGWVPIRKAWTGGIIDDANGQRWTLPAGLAPHAVEARWLRAGLGEEVEALLLPNGSSRVSAMQVTAAGMSMIVPLPATA